MAGRGASTLALAGVAAVLSGCGVRYVTSSAYHQLDLLAHREPADEVLASGVLSAGEEQRVALVPRIKAYGRELGLSSTHNYDTVALGWNHTIWNVSASAPLAFEPVTWWFPVVGRVPYLGFFTDAEADRWVGKLREGGNDVYKRSAGAYSTLGWFRDPLLPQMLRWSEADLAETVFHELAHATLWVPGSVSFNESFANFVGVESCHRYLASTYGPDSRELADTLRGERDGDRFVAILQGLYRDLDAAFGDVALDDAAKAARKAELYASLAARVEASEIEDKPRYVAWIARGEWNNARLGQFRTYNSNTESFAALLARNDGELSAFIEDIRRITRHRRDPFAALAEAVAMPPAGAGSDTVRNP